MKKLWFSIFDFSFDYKGPETPFIPSDNLDWADDLSKHTAEIKNELMHFLEKNNLESYFNTSMVTRKNSWRTIALKNWDIELYKNQKQFPVTTALIKKYPSIISASFNLLEGNSKILAHCGDTNAIYRCHLGLEIPAGLPQCGFRVKEESRPWEYGKWMIFMDAYNHEAWNNSEKGRYIFLIDVLRDEFASEKNTVISTVRTSLFLQKRLEKNKFLSFLFKPTPTKVITLILRPFALVAIKLVNIFRVY